MNLSTLTPVQLRKAAAIKEQIEKLHKQLNQLNPLGRKGSGMPSPFKAKRKMSAAGLARIRAAQKARWAKIKGTKAKTTKPTKRKMSAGARAKLAALAKARWAKVKAAGKKSL